MKVANPPKEKLFYFLRYLCIFMMAASTFSLSVVLGQSADTPQLAPPNPAFVEYMQEAAVANLAPLTSPLHAFGYIPSPVDLSHLAAPSPNRALQFPIYYGPPPSSYDLRDEQRLTPVKDQGNCGSCWAFATTGSLESNLLPDEIWEFSENHLKNTSGFLWDHCEGGDYFMAMAYLARWSGPVDEADDPYNATSDISPEGLTAQKHIQKVEIIPDRTGPYDNDLIKQVLMNYGALSTAMHFDYPYYDSDKHTFYYAGEVASNHAVVIVGWDDNYLASNFVSSPPGNGAFIVRNSWGEGWGDGGYFYISYHDSKIGKVNYLFHTAEETDNYTRIYQHDPLGWTRNVGYTGQNTSWAANIFTAMASEKISAVSFYTTSADAAYTIYIYTDAVSGPRSGVLAAGPLSGGFTWPGYHTVPLPSPVFIGSGRKFSIVLEMTTPGYNSPIAIERPVASHSSPTAGPGESYISRTGDEWTDLTTIYENTNVCIKAFARKVEADLGIQKTVSPNPTTVGNDLTYTITVVNHGPENAADVTVTDTLPAGVDYVSVAPSQGTCYGESIVTCEVGSINNGDAVAIILVVRPNAAGEITNTATVTASTHDPAAANDSDAAGTVVSNPVPAISSLSPSSVYKGGSAFTLTVTGTNFVPASRVRFNGVDRDTTFVSYTRLTAQIAAADIANAGTADISVFNPGPGGGPSNDLIFSVVVPTAGVGGQEGGSGGGGGCFIDTAVFGF